jgi:hypothetical protein
MSDDKRFTETEAHRHFAASLNGRVWQLLEKKDRSSEDDELMVHAAHASCLHWLEIGTGLHQQRGEWLIARVYASLGHAEAALRHANRCIELTERYTEMMEDYDRAYAFEGLARAYAVAGRRQDAARFREKASEAGEAIEDPEAKTYFVGDLAWGDWHGIT